MSTAAFSASTLSSLGARLQSERERIAALVAHLQHDAEASAERDMSDLLDDASPDGGSDDLDRDRARALLSITRRSLEDVDAALARLDALTYGWCARCRSRIPLARLRALPTAVRCVACEAWEASPLRGLDGGRDRRTVGSRARTREVVA